MAIVGGGPGGSTAGTLLRKYAPHLRVLILERETFPRDHVGESLLPIVCRVLNEMGCYDKVEAAGFPVKIGATYRWGNSDDLWDFDFLGGKPYIDEPRPAPYASQRTKTAYQVDRAEYDKILLDHARSVGVEVRESTRVIDVVVDGDAVSHLKLEDGTVISARYYIDASGHSGIIRRSLGVPIQEPSKLRNIAFWAYWQNADWAVNIGVSGTRIQVMSLGWGWIWFIPIGPTRTSIGLVVPVDHYKKSGKKPDEIYSEAVQAEPRVATLLNNATQEPGLHSTSDWSFVAERIAGENWFLVGESAGFADPILSAGLTLTQTGAWEAAITIAEIEKGRFDRAWLCSEFDRQQARRVRTHIRFADYWYTANTHFTDLVDYVSEIAKDSSLALDPKSAWQWLGTGGFVDTDMGGAGVGGFSLASTTWLVGEFTGIPPEWNIVKNNLFNLNLFDAEETWIAAYRPGFVDRLPALKRGDRILPVGDATQFLINTLSRVQRMDEILEQIRNVWCARGGHAPGLMSRALQVLEAMVNDSWVTASHDPAVPTLNLSKMGEWCQFHKNVDNRPIE